MEAADAYGSSAQSAQATVKTAAAAASGGCHVTYSVTNQWNTGFQGALTIQNTGSAAISSWTLGWTFPNNQQITGLWNANYSQSGEAVTATSESYNGAIAAGSTYSGVGFIANYSGANSVPVSFTLNGVVCK